MVRYIPLHKILNSSRGVDTLIAQKGKEQKSWGDWLFDVKQCHHFFLSQKEKTWALYCDDTYEFLVLLFALWGADKIACVPGSNQPAVVKSLEGYVDGFVGEFNAKNLSKSTVLGLSEIKKTSSVRPLKILSNNESSLDIELDLDSQVLQVFTSGSSGDPELISKSLSQLNAEINNIHQLWKDNGQGAIVLSTVSHHHIYGLLFRALWPLAEGYCFNSSLCEFFEDISRLSQAATKIVLVSSPTHLSRIPQDTDWSEIKKRCSAVFSSGAPLPKSASLDAKKHFDFSPIEVFGSSETGGIAWRQQQEKIDEKWMPFPEIELSLESSSQCLQIRSPYLPPQADGEWYVTSDKVKFDDDSTCFQLLGRVDNIVKVEGKRVSISEMERRLKDHEWIDDARAVVLSGARTEIGVTVVLSGKGLTELQKSSRLTFNKTMQSYLLNYFERPVLPRRWRMVEEMPFNSQGKITQKSLLDLFDGSDNISSKNKPATHPVILSKNHFEDTLTYTMEAPRNLLYFDGHFDATPILPGVVQLHWALYYGKQDLGVQGSFLNMEAIKFQNVIKPDQKFMLDLEFDAVKKKLKFKYYSESGAHSSGRIVITSNVNG